MLFSQMEPPPDREAEFHRWYDERHVPSRLAVPGFRSAVRAEAIDGTTRFAVRYDLDDLGALDSSPYQRLKSEPDPQTAEMLAVARGFTRYTTRLVVEAGEVGRGEGMVVTGAIIHGADATAVRWLTEELVPGLVDDERWGTVQLHERIGSCDGPPWTHLLVQDLAVDIDPIDAHEVDELLRPPPRVAPAIRDWTHLRYRPFRRVHSGA